MAYPRRVHLALQFRFLRQGLVYGTFSPPIITPCTFVESLTVGYIYLIESR